MQDLVVPVTAILCSNCVHGLVVEQSETLVGALHE
jgi:hypothetical protein